MWQIVSRDCVYTSYLDTSRPANRLYPAAGICCSNRSVLVANRLCGMWYPRHWSNMARCVGDMRKTSCRACSYPGGEPCEIAGNEWQFSLQEKHCPFIVERTLLLAGVATTTLLSVSSFMPAAFRGLYWQVDFTRHARPGHL